MRVGIEQRGDDGAAECAGAAGDHDMAAGKFHL
jgi:hypothetical protein